MCNSGISFLCAQQFTGWVYINKPTLAIHVGSRRATPLWFCVWQPSKWTLSLRNTALLVQAFFPYLGFFADFPYIVHKNTRKLIKISILNYLCSVCSLWILPSRSTRIYRGKSRNRPRLFLLRLLCFCLYLLYIYVSFLEQRTVKTHLFYASRRGTI